MADGQWEHVFEFIQPLESISTFDKRQVRYILNKYKYIELLCIKFEIGPFENAENCVKKIVDCLKELENYCPSKEDYNNFCLLLTLENFDQHSDYKNWNPSLSRIKCFNEVLKFIEKYLPIIKRSDSKPTTRSSKGDRLVQIIIKGLLYEACLEYCQNRAITSSSDQVNFEFLNLLEETKLHRSDSSLLSWLQAIPAETFNFQFEDRKLNVNIEKLDRPALIATWSEMMLTPPIKPKVFPHFATPFTRLKATDLMSKSLTSGIVDGLSKSIMSFSLKDAVDLSHSSIATTEFHLSQTSPKKSEVNKLNVTTANPSNGRMNDEKLMEKMFEHGSVFNSSIFGKLSTINEDKIVQDKENRSDATFRKDDSQSIEVMKMQLERFADAQWKEFLRKKDELLMESVNKSMINELKQPTNRLMTTITADQTTPVNQMGQTNFKDLESLKFTSTPKATPKENQIESTAVDYNPVRLNFSGISADSSTTTVTSDFQNQTTKLAANNFNMISPKNPLNTNRHLSNISNQLNVSCFFL